MPKTAFMFAGYPAAPVYKTKGGKTSIRQLLWGDWVRLMGQAEEGWVPVSVRGTKGWMKTASLQKQRCLEVIFLDVGQGDGCLMITPDDRHVLIDAGISDNMLRFLRWRYNGFKSTWTFDTAVITHPDEDHYGGFRAIFGEPNVRFKAVYHNGIVERAGKDSLGPSSPGGDPKFLTGIIRTEEQLDEFLSDPAAWTGKNYPKLLHTAFTSERVGKIESLAAQDGYVPGYGEDQTVRLKVLGPVLEPDADGADRLRWFSGTKKYDVGKTKNGHSVLLRLEYGKLRLLFGGDLNTPAEKFLLSHYTSAAQTDEERTAAAREVFGCDVAKSCHHGSGDFSDEFLAALLPAATVISSGDEESHAHPRSNTLGAIGLHGRKPRPLIFSTELSRSSRERESTEVLKKIASLREQIAAKKNTEAMAELFTAYDTHVKELEKRNVTVYGAINLRSDGNKVVLAYRLERRRHGFTGVTEWDIYKLEPGADGQLAYVP